jgi:hypothetical protein
MLSTPYPGRNSRPVLSSASMEYVIDHLVEDVADEIARDHPVLLVEQPLMKAQAKEYVRQTQERLIGAPILQLVKAHRGEDRTPRAHGTAQRLLALLDGWRGRPPTEQAMGRAT